MPKRASFGSTTNPGKLHPETFNTSHFPLSLHPISLPSVLCSPLFPLISPLVIPGLCDCGVSLQSWQIVLFFSSSLLISCLIFGLAHLKPLQLPCCNPPIPHPHLLLLLPPFPPSRRVFSCNLSACHLGLACFFSMFREVMAEYRRPAATETQKGTICSPFFCDKHGGVKGGGGSRDQDWDLANAHSHTQSDDDEAISSPNLPMLI